MTGALAFVVGVAVLVFIVLAWIGCWAYALYEFGRKP